MKKAPNWLALAARKSQEQTWTLGWLFSQCQEIESTASAQLAAELNCDLETLYWLQLCRIPREERFSDDVGQIATRFDLDMARLASLIRRADALTALSTERSSSESGMLLAARDREDGNG